MHLKRKQCNSFLTVNMAIGVDRGRVRPTTTTETRNIAAILQLIGRLRHAAMVYSVHI